MIDTKKLRRLSQAALTGPDGVSLNWLKLLQDFQKEANPTAVSELLDRLEAAESDAIGQARLNGMGASREAALMAKLEAAEKGRDVLRDRLALESQENGALRDSVDRACEERDALQAKVEAMERQEPPHGWWDDLIADISAIDCMYRGSPTYAHDAYWMRDRVVWMLKQRRDSTPGAKGE